MPLSIKTKPWSPIKEFLTFRPSKFQCCVPRISFIVRLLSYCLDVQAVKVSDEVTAKDPANKKSRNKKPRKSVSVLELNFVSVRVTRLGEFSRVWLFVYCIFKLQKYLKFFGYYLQS
jgi:hypothetical protein